MDLQLEKERIEKTKWGEGCHCKACGQFVKGYKRKITDGMAVFLAWLVQQRIKTKKKFHSYKDFGKVLGADYAKLEYWGLIRRMKKSPTEQKKSSGYWTPTRKGYLFLMGKISVQKYAFVFNGELSGFSVDMITFKECLKEPFIYSEIMETMKHG
jgi:hypothetical protein